MGSSQSHPIFLALRELLHSKNVRLTKATLQRFLNECDAIAPWFAGSGNLSVASWDKLGKDLDFAWEQGTLKPCVRPVWRLVRSCLEDQEGNKKAIANGQAALEMLQEERSEQSESERKKEKRKGNKKRVYPSLGRLRKELKEPGEDSGSEQDICEDEDLMEDEEGEIIELMEKHSLKIPEKQRPKMATVKQGHRPFAPPPYCSQEEVEAPGCSTFCPEVWCTVRTEFWITQPLAYPVFTDSNQQRYHEPIDFKIVKALAESVRTYGVTAAFTIAQVEAVTRFCMTPSDWINLLRACLSPGQFWIGELSKLNLSMIKVGYTGSPGPAPGAPPVAGSPAHRRKPRWWAEVRLWCRRCPGPPRPPRGPSSDQSWLSRESKQEIHRRSARLRNTKYKSAPAAEKKVSTKGKGRRHIFKLKNPIKAPESVSTIITAESIFYKGVYYQIGDVVSVVDEQDGKPYYAQIRGFIQDQYCEKSAALTWLIPTLASPRDQFDPASYIIGPEEDLPRKMEYLEFVCHAPSEYFKSRSSPFPTVPTRPEKGYIWTHVGPTPAITIKETVTNHV
ncbi:GATA zinc finger domain containing 1 [Cricetulus griseus]